MENIVLQDGRKEQIKIVGEKQTCVHTWTSTYRAGLENIMVAAIAAIAIDRTA